MLYRSVLQRQIEQLEEELAEFERGGIRVSRRIEGHVSWDDFTHTMMMRTRARIDALREIADELPNAI